MELREQHLDSDTGQSRAEYDNLILAAWRDCVAVCMFQRVREIQNRETKRRERNQM